MKPDPGTTVGTNELLSYATSSRIKRGEKNCQKPMTFRPFLRQTYIPTQAKNLIIVETNRDVRVNYNYNHLMFGKHPM